jgi:hypothetical protein
MTTSAAPHRAEAEPGTTQSRSPKQRLQPLCRNRHQAIDLIAPVIGISKGFTAPRMAISSRRLLIGFTKCCRQLKLAKAAPTAVKATVVLTIFER